MHTADVPTVVDHDGAAVDCVATAIPGTFSNTNSHVCPRPPSRVLDRLKVPSTDLDGLVEVQRVDVLHVGGIEPRGVLPRKPKRICRKESLTEGDQRTVGFTGFFDRFDCTLGGRVSIEDDRGDLGDGGTDQEKDSWAR